MGYTMVLFAMTPVALLLVTPFGLTLRYPLQRHHRFPRRHERTKNTNKKLLRASLRSLRSLRLLS
jgi:hypothetical protein